MYPCHTVQVPANREHTTRNQPFDAQAFTASPTPDPHIIHGPGDCSQLAQLPLSDAAIETAIKVRTVHTQTASSIIFWWLSLQVSVCGTGGYGFGGRRVCSLDITQWSFHSRRIFPGLFQDIACSSCKLLSAFVPVLHSVAMKLTGQQGFLG